MNPVQLEYFRQKLLAWKGELLRESGETLSHLQEESLSEPDLADRASLETDRSLELRTRDRERKLIQKIDEAIGRIEDGSYGYCEETGEPISLKRLEARPIAAGNSGSSRNDTSAWNARIATTDRREIHFGGGKKTAGPSRIRRFHLRLQNQVRVIETPPSTRAAVPVTKLASSEAR